MSLTSLYAQMLLPVKLVLQVHAGSTRGGSIFHARDRKKRAIKR
jgi:hypothetical protein